MTQFNDLGLAAPILKALTETGYETPTPIQLQAIPPVLQGRDVLGIAQTGTGKTAAFALPILQRLATDRRPTPRRGARALVLSPTRELATQIAESFRTYGRHLGFSVTVVFGGVSERPQAQALTRGVDILVATPGRLLDHMGQRNVALATTEVFVLDEADQMLDLGFFRPIRQIVAQLPMRRQSLFFSATMPKEIEQLTRELLRDPVKVEVAPRATTVESVSQRVIHVEANKKKALLVELLADAAMLRTLVFTRTKRGADRVAKHLAGAGIAVSAIHGNKSQNQREASLDAFRVGRIRALVATDIAARGIDIDEVTHVVNFDLPEVPEAYVHRIGRTARAGAAGAALAFCDGAERHLLRDIERLTRQTIASEDRRNDAKLGSDRPAGDRGLGGQHRGSGRPRHEGRNGHAPRGRDGPTARGPSRDGAQRGGRPFNGARGDRDRDGSRDRIWTNQPGGDRDRGGGHRAKDDLRTGHAGGHRDDRGGSGTRPHNGHRSGATRHEGQRHAHEGARRHEGLGSPPGGKPVHGERKSQASERGARPARPAWSGRRDRDRAGRAGGKH